MQTNHQTPGNVSQIENLLGEVYQELTGLTEENFEQNFKSAKSKMQSALQIKLQNSTKTNNFKPSGKIIQLAKLISDKYDNVSKDWANKLKLVKKEIELSQNQKKITIYTR